MKKFYNIIGICIIIVFLLSCKYLADSKTNPIDESVNYEDELFNTASLYEFNSEDIYTLNSISTSPAEKDYADYTGSAYTFDLDYENEFIQDMKFPGFPSNLETPKHNLDDLKYFKFNRAQKKIISSARKRISKLVDDSSTLYDKFFLKEGINNVEFRLVESSELFENNGNVLVANYYNGVIYVNKDKVDLFFEHTASHELVHHLRHLTYFGDSNYDSDIPYGGMPFDEAMTEAITLSTNAYLPSNVIGYLPYTYNAFRYIDTFKEDVLKAYFYGFDDFLKNTGDDTFQVEHDAFIASFNGYATEHYDLMNQLSIDILNKMKSTVNK